MALSGDRLIFDQIVVAAKVEDAALLFVAELASSCCWRDRFHRGHTSVGGHGEIIDRNGRWTIARM